MAWSIMHMTQFEFLNLAHLKQVQLLVSIHVHGKFWFLPTSTLVGFPRKHSTIYFTSRNQLCVESLITLLAINYSDDVSHNMKSKFDFDECK
jgi:hypothetical protein